MEVETECGMGRQVARAGRKRARSRRGSVAASVPVSAAVAEKEVPSLEVPSLEKQREAEAEAAATLAAEERFLAREASRFRDVWNRFWSGYFGSFEDTTRIKAMRYTDEPAPPVSSSCGNTLQIFSVKVAGIRGGLQWPLHVFGMVALRDAVDRNRNIIFQRTRDNCQTLTEKDPYLVLTGPTRAVVSLDPMIFEVELIVKGATPFEDKCLSFLAVSFVYCDLACSRLLIRDYTTKFSTLELTCAHLQYSVEASISVQVIKGTLDGYRVQFAASTTSIGQREAILLDSCDGKVPVNGDGNIQLSRHVASVGLHEKLKVSVKIWKNGNNFVEKERFFTPKEANRSVSMLNVGSCKMRVTIAWSLLSFEPPSL